MLDDNKNANNLIVRDEHTIDWVDEIQEKENLNPVKHPQKDFFIADLFDVDILQLDQVSMEFPFFSLRPRDVQKREYSQKDHKVVIVPNQHYGMATIHDQDIWLYCVSKMMEAKSKGKEISKVVHFTIYDYLKTTNRGVSGRDYERAIESLERLDSTRIRTTINNETKRNDKGFGLIENWEIEEEKNGRMIRVAVTLPNFLFNSINNSNVLAIHQDYFRIRKPLDRRLYQIAKKHCGYNDEWPFKITTLHERSGSSANLREFKRSIKALVKTDHLPDYRVKYDEKTEKVTFVNRSPTLKKPKDLSLYVSVYEFELGIYGAKNANAFDTAVAVFKAGKYLSQEVQEKYKLVGARFMQAKRKAQRELRDEANAARFDKPLVEENKQELETKTEFDEADYGDLDIIVRSNKSEILIDQAKNALLRLYASFGADKIDKILSEMPDFDLKHLEKLDIFDGVY